jgi:hypothetical protein
MAISYLEDAEYGFDGKVLNDKWIQIGHIQPGSFSIGEEKPTVHVPTLTVTEDLQLAVKKFELKLSDLKVSVNMSYEFMAEIPDNELKGFLHARFLDAIEQNSDLSDDDKAKYKAEVEAFYKPKATGGLVTGNSIVVGHGEVYIWPSGAFKTGHIFLEDSKPSVSTKSRQLPGMDHKVKCPLLGHKIGDHFLFDGTKKTIFCTDKNPVSLWSQVQHLNDEHKWTREQIADWLDELHDSGEVNLEFEPWEGTE